MSLRFVHFSKHYQNLLPEDKKLTPDDPLKMAIVTKWIEKGEMQTGELFGPGATPEAGMQKRLGNMLPIITMPVFCAISEFNPVPMERKSGL